MEEVRDDSMNFLKRLVEGQMADSVSKKLSVELQNLSPKQLVTIKKLLAQAVDAGIVRFLNLFDAYEIGIQLKDDSGKTHDVRKLSDGLVGELYSDNGWQAQFSKFGDSV
jgi:hypothetical protein